MKSKGIVRLGDLPLGIFTGARLGEHQEILEVKSVKYVDSPIYRSLLQLQQPSGGGGEAIYEDYRLLVKELTGNLQRGWTDFLELRTQIADCDFVNSFPPIYVTRTQQLDGHHRLALLLELRGPRAKSLVVDGVVFVPRRPDTVIPKDSCLKVETVLRRYKWERPVSISDEDGLWGALVQRLAPELHQTFEFRAVP